MRKTLKPWNSGNASAASGDTKAKTAAGTAPWTNTLIAFVGIPISSTSEAPAATIAVLTLRTDAECLSSIAMVLLVRSACCVILLALIGYQLCKNVKRSLSVRRSPREKPCMVNVAQRGFAVARTNPRKMIFSRREDAADLVPGAPARSQNMD